MNAWELWLLRKMMMEESYQRYQENVKDDYEYHRTWFPCAQDIFKYYHGYYGIVGWFVLDEVKTPKNVLKAVGRQRDKNIKNGFVRIKGLTFPYGAALESNLSAIPKVHPNSLVVLL